MYKDYFHRELMIYTTHPHIWETFSKRKCELRFQFFYFRSPNYIFDKQGVCLLVIHILASSHNNKCITHLN